MPYRTQNFQPLNLAQLNPVAYGLEQGIAGIGSGADLYSKILESQKAKAELPYVGETAKANAMYKEAMANYLSQPNQQLRFLSNTGKTFVEPGIVSQILKSHGVNTGNGQVSGMYVDTGEGNAPDQGNGNNNNTINDAYELQRQKITTDAQARNRNLFANNIEKTIGFINPKDLTAYSGIQGQAEKKYDSVMSGLGHGSEKYNKYLNSKQASEFLAKQVRQFYGASIQPEMEMSLAKLTDPSFWDRDPEQAEKLFGQTTDILKTEIGTYRGAMESVAPYRENKQNNSQEKRITKRWKMIKGKLVEG